MKPFNFELAKQGHPICTRDGHKARIICFDAKGRYPIVALVDGGDDGEGPVSYMTNGQVRSGLETEFDLFMVPIKHEGWVNVFCGKHGCYVDREIWDFEENAKAVGKEFTEYITSVKIEWEE